MRVELEITDEADGRRLHVVHREVERGGLAEFLREMSERAVQALEEDD